MRLEELRFRGGPQSSRNGSYVTRGRGRGENKSEDLGLHSQRLGNENTGRICSMLGKMAVPSRSEAPERC